MEVPLHRRPAHARQTIAYKSQPFAIRWLLLRTRLHCCASHLRQIFKTGVAAAATACTPLWCSTEHRRKGPATESEPCMALHGSSWSAQLVRAARQNARCCGMCALALSCWDCMRVGVARVGHQAAGSQGDAGTKREGGRRRTRRAHGMMLVDARHAYYIYSNSTVHSETYYAYCAYYYCVTTSCSTCILLV